jgi:outer membrane protein assembly factor BamB
MADRISPAGDNPIIQGNTRRKETGKRAAKGDSGDVFVQSSRGGGSNKGGLMASASSVIDASRANGVSTGNAAQVILDGAQVDRIDCTPLWNYDIEGELLGELCPGDDGTVYFSTSRGKLTAVKEGRETWSLSIPGEYMSAPERALDGTLHVTGDSTLYAIRDGEKKWELKLGKAILNKPALGDDGTVYATSTKGTLYAVKEGEKRWSFSSSGLLQSTDPFQASPCVGPDGTVYAGTKSGKVFAIRDGKKIWDFQVNGSIDQAPVIGPGGTLIVGTHQGHIYALKDGKHLWDVNSNDKLESPLNVAADGTVYFVGADGQFHFAGGWRCYAVAIKDGRKLWSIAGDEYANASSKALVFPGVFFTGDPHSFHAASDGKTIHSEKKKNVGYTSKPPAVAPDGRLYVPITAESISAFALKRPLADLIQPGNDGTPPKSSVETQDEWVSIDGVKLPINEQSAMQKLSVPSAAIRRRRKEKK